MVASMTAFARHSVQQEWGNAVWEIRTVNHRYLDISIRMPDELRSLEPAIRERIGKQLSRGKVDCTLRFSRSEKMADIRLNEDQLEPLLGVIDNVNLRLEKPAAISALDVLNWPGILAEHEVDAEIISRDLLALLDTTLATLAADRQREGDKLREIVIDRCQQARAQVTELKPKLPAIIDAIAERYRKRAQEMDVELDAGRLEQEMVLIAQKLDVAEEMDRLEEHLDEVSRVLNKKGPVGRRLDFLMQEMNREANTLGSKSAASDSTSTSVELKVLIEQMREQIQNIE